MNSITGQLPFLTAWPSTASLLLFTAAIVFVTYLLWRTPFPANAPKVWSGDDWPVLGSIRFYLARREMLRRAQSTTGTGNVSFYLGKKRVISVSASTEARETFFESKDLHFHIGNRDLFPGQPPTVSPKHMKRVAQWFNKMLVNVLKSDSLSHKLQLMTGDVRHTFEALTVHPETTGKWLVMNTFDDLYGLVYRLTMRALGPFEIVDDPALLNQTLSLFEQFEQYNSPSNIIFPWLPTRDYVAKLYLSFRLFWIFRGIVKQRKRTGEKPADTVQYLLDAGSSIEQIAQFEIASIFAGQINSGIVTAWLPIYWSQYPEWKMKVREEVDAAIARHRTSPCQLPMDVLGSLSLEDWEAEFPMIDLSLRESIRLGFTMTSFRKNISNKDVEIGSTGEVIPKGTYAVFHIDNVHMNPGIYHDPLVFDPSRYLNGRAEDKKYPHTFIGWGSGRHPCLGTRFAKLEAIMIGASLTAMFDYELSDKDGRQLAVPPPPVNRNQTQTQKPAEPVYIRLKVREP